MALACSPARASGPGRCGASINTPGTGHLLCGPLAAHLGEAVPRQRFTDVPQAGFEDKCTVLEAAQVAPPPESQAGSLSRLRGATQWRPNAAFKAPGGAGGVSSSYHHLTPRTLICKLEDLENRVGPTLVSGNPREQQNSSCIQNIGCSLMPQHCPVGQASPSC